MILIYLIFRQRKEDTLSVNEVTGYITLERNGKATDLFPGEVSTNRITAIQVILLLIDLKLQKFHLIIKH